MQQQAVQRCTIRQAVLAHRYASRCTRRWAGVRHAHGVLPPAIPVAVSGEEITPAAIALMQRYGIEELSVLR